MDQTDRDRLVTLKRARKILITQRQAAEELDISARHVKRLLRALKRRGDKAVVRGARGELSNPKIADSGEQDAVRILSAPVYEGFGPTLAGAYLRKKHGIAVSKETVRQWMIHAKLWRAKKERATRVHAWRPRRSRFGELVQWDTSEHDWLAGRGEKLYRIALIDDATSRLLARFVRHDSTAGNMKLLWSYLGKYGRPLAFYTDKASHFQTAAKRRCDEPALGRQTVSDRAARGESRVARSQCTRGSAAGRFAGVRFSERHLRPSLKKAIAVSNATSQANCTSEAARRRPATLLGIGDAFGGFPKKRSATNTFYEAWRNLSVRRGFAESRPWTEAAQPPASSSDPRPPNASGEPRSAHRPDEFQPAIPRSGWSPLEPVSASPE